MKKEFGAKEYVTNMNELLDAARIVASNMAFNAAGLAAGEEEVHHKKLLLSLVNLRVRVEGLLRELADEGDVVDAERELAKKAVEVILERFKKECDE